MSAAYNLMFISHILAWLAASRKAREQGERKSVAPETEDLIFSENFSAQRVQKALVASNGRGKINALCIMKNKRKSSF